MCESIKGKKLLLLAGSVHMADLVRRAKELGVYTIATDYNNVYDSPAKRIADEYWDISWADIDKLEAACKEAKIDGVVAGYSEFTVENAIKLCQRLNLPFYCTNKQLDITRNKDLFKKTCNENGVPTIHEYATKEEVNHYPVIVKPVDRGGSIGISVANNKAELERAVDYAYEMSVCKKIIIEDFIADGIKIDIYYGIINGEVTLLTTSDTISAEGNRSDEGFSKVIQNGWVCPPRYHDAIVEKVDQSLKRMIENMGVKYGFFFFSGFAMERPDGVDFALFETGFRLSGGHLYNYFKETGFIDIQDIFIYHALLGDSYTMPIGQLTKPDCKALIINYYATEGVIDSIEGSDLIANMSDCRLGFIFGRKGEKVSKSEAILSKLAMYHFYNQSAAELAKDAEYANHAFVTLDTHGEDIVFERINPQTIEKWWNEGK